MTAPQTVLLPIGSNSTPEDVAAATRAVARHYNGRLGEFAYQAFDYINDTLFAGDLPHPLILWNITAYGHCLGQTWLKAEETPEPPVIILHPAILSGGVSRDPFGHHHPAWGIKHLGVPYAFEVLIHECIHLSVHYILGGATGETSHNCPEWIAEVNRIAPLIGLGGFIAGGNKVKRVAVPELGPTKTGKVATKVKRVSGSEWRGQPVPYKAVCRFPHALRALTGDLAFYKAPLPFEHCLDGGGAPSPT